jgi:phage I-like protein
MPTVRLNDGTFRAAAEAIAAGDFDASSSWTFSRDDQTAILNPDDGPARWDEYERVHLGLLTGAPRKTKKAYDYPIAKDGKVFRSALLDARKLAGALNHGAIFEATGKLLGAIDAEDGIEQDAEAKVAAMALSGDRVTELLSLEAVDIGDLKQTIVQVLPFTGDDYVTAIDGRQFRVSEFSLERIAEAFADRQNPLLLDYEHDTYNPMATMGSVAAGWIFEVFTVGPDEEVADEEVLAKVEEYGPGVYARVDLTEKAASLIAGREYMFLSPVIHTNDEGTVFEFRGAGLTNDPALDGMMPVAARRTADGADPESGNGREPEPTTEDDMDLEKLSAIFGRPITGEGDLLAAVEGLKGDSAKLEAAKSELEALKADQLDRDATEAVAAAIEKGQLADAQKGWAEDLFKNDRAAWDAYLAATAEGAFTRKTEDPPTPPKPGRNTADPNDNANNSPADREGVSIPSTVSAFSRTIPVEQDKADQLSRAVLLAREKFDGDLARAIRSIQRG